MTKEKDICWYPECGREATWHIRHYGTSTEDSYVCNDHYPDGFGPGEGARRACRLGLGAEETKEALAF